MEVEVIEVGGQAGVIDFTGRHQGARTQTHNTCAVIGYRGRRYRIANFWLTAAASLPPLSSTCPHTLLFTP